MIIHGDAISLPLADRSVDSIVCDPPAGIAFMGKSWDKDKGGRDNWIAWMQTVATEAMRVIKPGGHALVWAIPRTSHWTGVAWENAGWQPRDKVYHCFGSGFPKSLAVDKAIDAHLKVERFAIGTTKGKGGENLNTLSRVKGNDTPTAKGCGAYGIGAKQITVDIPITAPATDEAKQWDGWGTALKPAIEEWWLFRKPLDGTVAQNVLKWGVGGLNIDGSRVGTEPPSPRNAPKKIIRGGKFHSGAEAEKEMSFYNPSQGRFPANLIHDGSDEVMALFPESKSCSSPSEAKPESKYRPSQKGYQPQGTIYPGDSGSAARFFYCAKASKADRDEGLAGMPDVLTMRYGEKAQGPLPQQTPAKPVLQKNGHPTVKPVSLMQYLCKLITPPNGIILDMFCGSGSTGKAAAREGFRFIGIEREWEYCQIAKARCDHEATKPNQMRLAA